MLIYTQGNCKFGAKCALAHILPDGRRVNRPNMGMGMGMGGGHLNLGGRVNPQTYHNQDSALANSLLTQQQINGHPSQYGPQYPYPGQEDFSSSPRQPRPPYENIVIETGVMSDPSSQYGSPIDEVRLPISPVPHLTARDAPLPASFDSQGISYMARHGPVAASVPSKFGLESSPPSLPQKPGPSDVIRTLHDTAFGPSSRKTTTAYGSSPPVVQDETFGQRVMHSQRNSRPKIMSASLPRPGMTDDWDDNFAFEEDYLPTGIHDDVLTPQEKMRRLSRTEQDLNSNKESSTGLGIPAGNSSKVGSPLASSPSRFGALFAKQRQKKEEESLAGSGFGHVGSPLRESSLHPGVSPSLRPIGSRPQSGDISPFLSSPPRQSSMSMLSQQVSRIRIGKTESSESGPTLHPSSARHSSNTNSRFDRAVSSPSVSTSRIDEEQGDLVFSMEEEENSKRNSMVWSSKSPSLGPVKSTTNTASAQDVKDGKEYLKEINFYGGNA